MRERAGNLLVVWALVAGLASAPQAVAQTAATGALVGTVTDAGRAVVPGVTVRVVSRATGGIRTAVTDATGLYRVALLPPGVYSVEYSTQGFKTLTLERITINVTETQTLNAQLEVGAVVERVIVDAQPALVQAETTTLGQLIDDRTITSLPLVTRNYTQILGLSAGVTGSVTNAGELGKSSQDVYVNGMRNIDNNFQMDGTSVNNFGTGRAGNWLGYVGIAIPNPDFIQEFKIQTTLYDAGYGRKAGANVNIITKSGGKEFHGTVFEFFRNENLNANDFFFNRTGQPKPEFRQNQFGGTLGGPIVKDKLFFFAGYQGTRQINGLSRTASRTAFLPPLTNDRSAAILGAQFCGQTGAFGGIAIACDGSNINPVALALLNAKLPSGEFVIPTPQVIQANGLGFSAFSIPSKFREDQYLINIDYMVLAKHTLAGRWFYSKNPEKVSFTDANVPGSGVNNNFRNSNFVLKLTSFPRANFINEAKFSFTRNFGLSSTQTPITSAQIGLTPAAEKPQIPIILVLGLFEIGGNFNDDFKTAINSFQLGDQISWVHGRHNLRAGFEFERVQDNFDLPGVKRGELIFVSFPDFLLGMSAAQNGTAFSNVFFSIALGGALDKQLRINNYATFIQDDWKIHPQLTLNLGLRWEVNGGFSDAHGILSNFRPDLALAAGDPPPGGTLDGFVVPSNFSGNIPQGVTKIENKTTFDNGAPLHNWGPRLGLAWRPLARTDRLIVRAGYGVFYTRAHGNMGLQFILLPPFSAVNILGAQANALATFQVPFNPPLTPGIWPLRTPSTQLSAGFLPKNFDSPMTQQYSLNLQYEFARDFLLEVGYVGVRSTRLTRQRPWNQPILASPTNPVRGITTNTVANASMRVPILGFGPAGLLSVETYGFSTHNALHTTVRKRFSEGFQFQASYTLGKTLTDTIGADFNTVFSGGTTVGDVNDRKSRWGPADFDRRHRLILSYIWELPHFRQDQRFIGKLLGGWQISGITTFQSGLALSLLDTRAGSIFGFTGGAFGGPSQATLCPGFTHADIGTPGPVDQRLDNFFNNAAFCPPPAIGDGTGYGTLGRGVVSGPDQRNFDIALAKITRVGGLGENAILEFRAEFFNAFNTPQFDVPGRPAPQQTDPGLTVGSPNFGKISATTVAPRIIQFALKYVF